MEVSNFDLMDIESPIPFSKDRRYSNITSGSHSLTPSGGTLGGGSGCMQCSQMRCAYGCITISGCGQCKPDPSGSPTSLGGGGGSTLGGGTTSGGTTSGGGSVSLPSNPTTVIPPPTTSGGSTSTTPSTTPSSPSSPTSVGDGYGGSDAPIFGGGGGGGGMMERQGEGDSQNAEITTTDDSIFGMRPIIFYGLLIVAGILIYRYVKKRSGKKK